jgi:hypothetical protein
VEASVKRELTVKSTVITWPENTLEITDTAGAKHIVSLDKIITVTMVGYPDRETKTMPARDLGDFMTSGYIIEQISFEEE